MYTLTESSARSEVGGGEGYHAYCKQTMRRCRGTFSVLLGIFSGVPLQFPGFIAISGWIRITCSCVLRTEKSTSGRQVPYEELIKNEKLQQLRLSYSEIE